MKKPVSSILVASLGLLFLSACSDGGDGRGSGGADGGIDGGLDGGLDVGGDGDGDGDGSGDGDGDGDGSGDGDGDGSGDGDGDGDGDGSIKFDVGGGIGDGGPGACETLQPEVSFVPPVLVFVLDKSGSMSINTFNAGGQGFITRWHALHNTVEYLVNNFGGQVHFGSKKFPTTNGCPVSAGLDVNPAPNNAAPILASLPGKTANLNDGGTSYTPAQSGFREAKTHVEGLDPLGNRAVVLILDGDVSTSPCTTDTVAGLQADIAALYNNDGAPTYVVGIDIGAAGTTTNMNGFAEAGGMPKGNPGDPERFYNAVNQAELDAIMNDIVDQVLSCDVQLDVEPDNPGLTEVTVDGMSYDLITEAECNNDQPGWYYSVEYSQITLCGAACDGFLQVQTADVEYFCPQG